MASFKLAAAAAAILLFAASASLSLAERPATIPTYSDIGYFAVSPIPMIEDPIENGPAENPKHGHLAPGGDPRGVFELVDCLDILEEGGASDCITTVLNAVTLKGPLPTGQCCLNVLKLSKNSECWNLIAGYRPKVPAFEPLLLNYCEEEEGLVSPPPPPYMVMSS